MLHTRVIEEQFTDLEEIDLQSNSRMQMMNENLGDNEGAPTPTAVGLSNDSSNHAEDQFSQFEDFTRGDEGFVVVSSGNNETEQSLRIYLFRYMLSFVYIVGLGSGLILVFLVLNSSSSGLIFNLVTFFVIKLNFIGLLNTGFISLSLIPMIFGLKVGFLTFIFSAPILSIVTFVIYLSSQHYHPAMLLPGFYLQVLVALMLSSLEFVIRTVVSKVRKRRQLDQTEHVTVESKASTEGGEEERQEQTEQTQQQNPQQPSNTTFDARNIQLRSADLPVHEEEKLDNKTQEMLKNLEKELLRRNRQPKNILIIFLALLMLFTQLVADIVWVSLVPISPNMIVYWILIPLYPLMNWLIQKGAKLLIEKKLSDKLLVDSISMTFSIYCWKLMIVYLDSWPLFVVYQLFDIFHKCFIYFLWLPRPIFSIFDLVNVAIRMLLDKFTVLKLMGIVPKKKLEKRDADERYNRFIRSCSRKYYFFVFLDVHASLQLFLFYLAWGGFSFRFERESYLIPLIKFAINLLLSVPFFTFLPWIVRKVTLSNFNPLATGQVYVHTNIKKWFLAVGVASLCTFVALQDHKVLPMPWIYAGNHTVVPYGDTLDFLNS